ncbi:hypothetical protein [Peterkaempfera bronchialis]|uniref:hypothetical protein n=1 Tax=Peterkaempfera bronchialis TaxID=2126346 RepID=UPI003C2EA984
MTFVPYVEALAFWGRTVQQGTVPRTYAIGVLLGHPLITDHSPGSAEQKAKLVAADLDRWEDRVVEMVWDPEGDLLEDLRRCARLRVRPDQQDQQDQPGRPGRPDRPDRPQHTSG